MSFGFTAGSEGNRRSQLSQSLVVCFEGVGMSISEMSRNVFAKSGRKIDLVQLNDQSVSFLRGLTGKAALLATPTRFIVTGHNSLTAKSGRIQYLAPNCPLCDLQVLCITFESTPSHHRDVSMSNLDAPVPIREARRGLPFVAAKAAFASATGWSGSRQTSSDDLATLDEPVSLAGNKRARQPISRKHLEQSVRLFGETLHEDLHSDYACARKPYLSAAA